MDNKINFEEFKKIDLRIGRILVAEDIPESEKLVKLTVLLGEEKRQIVAGIKKSYPPETLQGREIVVVANLAPRTMLGYESNGMLLATREGEAIVLLKPERDVPEGSSVS
jgi:methionine--tRNA ligase beta chain